MDYATGNFKPANYTEQFPIGKFFQRTDLPSLDQAEPVLEGGPIALRQLGISEELAQEFVTELM